MRRLILLLLRLLLGNLIRKVRSACSGIRGGRNGRSWSELFAVDLHFLRNFAFCLNWGSYRLDRSGCLLSFYYFWLVRIVLLFVQCKGLLGLARITQIVNRQLFDALFVDLINFVVALKLLVLAESSLDA